MGRRTYVQVDDDAADTATATAAAIDLPHAIHPHHIHERQWCQVGDFRNARTREKRRE